MAKEKVYKLAQEFRMSSEALVQMLHTMGIKVKSHMSTVDENLRDEIKKRLEHERAEIKREYERKKQIRTKARMDAEEAAALPVPEAAAPAPAAPAEVPKGHTPPVRREIPVSTVRHAEPFRRSSERETRRDTYMPSAVATPRFAAPGAPIPATGGTGGAPGR
jgi:hypothetical protein